jgi:glyoxylase I family protein
MIETKGFLHITIGVTDLERATAFYRDILGCEIVNTNPIMTFMKTGDDFFVLTKTPNHVPPNAGGPLGHDNTLFHHAMIVAPERFDAALEWLASKGVEYFDCGFHHPTFPGRRHVYIMDPDGNSIELTTEVIPELLKEPPKAPAPAQHR